jgi:hypothetical protein
LEEEEKAFQLRFIARSWLLHWESSTQPTVLHPEWWKISGFVKIATIPQSSVPR